MSDIKNIIGYLCKYLNLLLDCTSDESAFKPEYIRLAKHNKTDNNTVFHFWTLLSKLLNTNFKFINDVSLVDQVKLQFAYYKYNSIEFYELPNNYCTGSRELLIALAWLLSNTNILSQLVEEKLAKSTLCDEFPKHQVDFKTEHIIQFNNGTACMNYISHLMVKINNNLRIRKDCDKTLLKNMKKIHCATKYDLDIPHLSVHDVYLARHPECQKRFIEDNEYIINLLEIKSKWESCQGTFWKWMLTVLDEKNNQRTGQDPNAELELIHFVDLLKSQVHKSPDQESKCTNENGIDNNNYNNLFNQLENVTRHVYFTPKLTKTSQTNAILSNHANVEKNYKNLLRNWKNLDKNCEEDSILVSNSASQITQKLKSLLEEHDLKYF